MGSPEERPLEDGVIHPLDPIDFIMVAKADEGTGQGTIYIIQNFRSGGKDSIDLIPEADFPTFWEHHLRRLKLFKNEEVKIKR